MLSPTSASSPFGELGLEEPAHFIHENGEGGLVCLQDVVGAVECDIGLRIVRLVS